MLFLIYRSLVKETGPEVAEDGSSFDHAEIVHLDYTGLFTTLVDLLHVIENVGEGHEGQSGWCFEWYC